MTMNPLKPDALKRRFDPKKLKFGTTAELKLLSGIMGQPRALEALKFGIGMPHKGFNLFALGPEALGKHTTIREYLQGISHSRPVPDDWCYVHNFDDTRRPRLLRLPSGNGLKLCRDMEQFIRDLPLLMVAVFNSDEYRSRRQLVDEAHAEQQSISLRKLQNEAKKRGVAIVSSPSGYLLRPIRAGEVMSPDEIQSLPLEEREVIDKKIQRFQKQLQDMISEIPRLDSKRREEVRKLNCDVTKLAVINLMESMRRSYDGYPQVISHLDALQKDIIEHVSSIRALSASQDKVTRDSASSESRAGLKQELSPEHLRRYRVNVLVNNTNVEGAPVVYEDNPAHARLVGRVGQFVQMGAAATDFNLIEAGALHRANGGYLIVEARKLLQQPDAYEALKRALRSEQVRIESPAQMYSMVSTVSLEPEAVPIDLKVILVGDREVYFKLAADDPEFPELFKVQVDFEEDIDRRFRTNHQYARLIAKLVHKHSLRHLDASGVARVMDHSSRLAGDSQKLTARMGLILDILLEADYWAEEKNRRVITSDDVQRAIEARSYRGDRLHSQSQELIRQGTILIDSSGSSVGQVNGLAVMSVGNIRFGKPSRITARVRMGTDGVLDIERKSELGGSIHSKGVFILASYLSSQFLRDRPLALTASLVFEQSYSGVDGDSASSTELYALLSALADVPVHQGLAVTGSIDQFGRVQAIGGVNEKIEGFFDLCQHRGLSGDQGVLIPDSNVRQLMLRDDVVEACASGYFHVYAVKTVNEGIAILTKKRAGRRMKNGEFPSGTINRLVEDRLISMAESRRDFGKA